jgi:hypothetical protein
MAVGLPFKLSDYFERVELTGRAIRHNKKGYIDTPTLMDSAIVLLDRKRRLGIANCKALLS